MYSTCAESPKPPCRYCAPECRRAAGRIPKFYLLDMNVCLFNDSFPPLIDGVANTVVNYATVIQQKYGAAMVATPKYPDVVDDYPFEVVRYPSLNTVKMVGYRTGNPFDARAMRRMSDWKPDILHAHCPMASLFMARELRNLTDAPLVFTYHTKFDIDIKQAFRIGAVSDAAIRAVVDNIAAADEVWAVNRGAGDNLRSLGFEGEIKIMPNGVEFPRGAAPEADIAAVRAELGIPADRVLFLFVGRMKWYKGQRTILDGLKRVRAAGGEFSMLFVGDGQELEEIRDYAAECGLADACIFAGKVLDRDRLRAIYSAADMLLLPSVFDNNPIVVKEAAACGTASVLVRDSSPAEGVENGRSGILISDDADDMARVLLSLCTDRELSRRLGEGAMDGLYVSWDDMIAQAVGRYEELIKMKERGELEARHAKLDRAIVAMSEIQNGLDRVHDFFAGNGPLF